MESSVKIENTSVKDGFIEVRITKLNTWGEFSAYGQKLNTGFTTEPTNLVLGISVEGVKEGEVVSIDEVAQLLQKQLDVLMPTARIFTKSAEDKFEPREDNF